MRQEIEIWRPVVGYEGQYEVSNLGRVRSLKFGKVKILNHYVHRYGYLRVDLCKNGKQKPHFVHRLVAQAFIPNPDNLPQVNHKDEDKTNNFVSLTNPEDSNLEWCTLQYNMAYGTRNKRIGASFSKAVLCIEMNIIFKSAMDAQRNLNIDNGSISKCCRGKLKTCGGYHWKYVNE